MTYGTTIQVYGRLFAGIVNMTMEKHYKIYHDYAGEPFKISNVSPFSIVGAKDKNIEKLIKSNQINTQIEADINKNFRHICKRANCDWLILDNTTALLSIAEINNQFYTVDSDESNSFIDYYKLAFPNEEEPTIINPVNEGVSKRLIDKYNTFINIVLEHYDPEHIILIRSDIKRFSFANGKVFKNKNNEKANAFIQQLDNHFAKATNCLVLDTSSRFFVSETDNTNNILNEDQEQLRYAVEQAVIAAIEDSTNIQRGLCNEFNQKQKSSDISLDLELSYKGAISNYIANGGTDSDIVHKYFKNMNCTFDDLAALFWLYEKLDLNQHLTDTGAIANTIISNENSRVYKNTKDLFERNIKKLSEYKYCAINLNNIEYENKIVISLDSKHFLEISLDGLKSISHLQDEIWDYHKFIENNYACSLAEINDAMESWETYFDRGRNACKTPFTLEFDNHDEFVKSLYYFDYTEMINNENYVISIQGDTSKISDYKPKVDLSFLFEEKTRIINVYSGLGDQKDYYSIGKKICDENGLNLYLDDLGYDKRSPHNGLELHRIVKEDINDKIFSNILSRKLRMRMCRETGDLGLPIKHNSKWIKLGLEEAYIVVWNSPFYSKYLNIYDSETPCLLSTDFMIARNTAINKISGKVLFYCPSHQNIYGFNEKDFWESNFAFPALSNSDSKNISLAKEMMSKDAVSIHIRRRDYVGFSYFSYSSEYDFYKTEIELVWNDKEFSKYKNKHLYVFSDDMDWVIQHAEELGLHIAGKQFTFVDWNHHFNSINDLHLISLSKVIIRSLGGFALTAAYISKIVEYVVWADPDTCKIEWKRDYIVDELT